MTKNEAAVYLGKLSAESRLKKLGAEGLSKKMKEIRRMGAQKKSYPQPSTETLDER